MGGFATYGELLRSGLSRARIRTMVQRGELIKLSRGVYIASELADRMRILPAADTAIRAMAVLAGLRPGTVVSHGTAAELHGLDQLSRGEQLIVTRPPGAGSRSSRKPGVVVHAAQLPASQLGWRLGVPVTTVARTVIDLARTLGFQEGLVVADSALHQRLTSKNELSAVLADCGRWRGAKRAAEVVEFADRLAESVLESLARVVFRDLGLPRPELQVEITDSKGEFIGRVDFLWRRFRTIAEVDGALKYDDRSRAQAQLRRDKMLRAASYEVEHFTWREIMHEQDAVGESLWAAFKRGSQLGTSEPAA
ncbi:MAG: type IV toxin-antitoxin system AbiEi family antitoxin domain-containing protein [Actinobacteria bacterium]|nr:type IV toxin-antitoxin system AbiEi family antitoxin domain-containing protein [Actinomycetota bacterium]